MTLERSSQFSIINTGKTFSRVSDINRDETHLDRNCSGEKILEGTSDLIDNTKLHQFLTKQEC